MKTYTVDFESDFIEAENDKEANRIALEHVDENYALWKDDIVDWRDGLTPYYNSENKSSQKYIGNDPAVPPLKTYMIEFTGYYIKAKNEDTAWKKAQKYAKAHNLEIIEMDEGYED